MSAYKAIKTNLIDVPEGRLREVDQDWATCLSEMFAETGHKTPIDVVASGTRYTLVAGAHRLAAARILKWKEIDARVLEPTAEQAAEELRLHEILENLGRKDFNALERCEALSELKRIYETLHPDAKNGGDRKSQAAKNKRENQNAIFAFCSSASETTGLSRRSVELAIQIFDCLSPESRERLKGTALAQKQSDLKALAVLEAGQQKAVLDLLFSEPPQAATIADALVVIEGRRPLTATDRMFRTVSDSLVKLPRASRNAVWRQHKAEIVALVKKEGWLDD